MNESMSTLPTEGTTSGGLCAALVVVAPLTAVILSAFVKNRILALVASLVVSGALIAAVASYALGADPDEDTLVIVGAFGGWAAILAVGISLVAFAARTLSARHRRAKAI